jgi:hypothetical protein
VLRGVAATTLRKSLMGGGPANQRVWVYRAGDEALLETPGSASAITHARPGVS